ncbi:MAG: acyltransferase [Deltaproteobacteria bacterium]|nr:acyltransferase [Deltaproteobacteria bacterium]
MKAAFIQTEPEFGRIEENVGDAVKKIETAADEGAALVVLPELFSTGYHFRSREEALKLAEDARGGYAVGKLAGAAKKRGLHIVAGFDEREGNKVYNSAALVGPRGVIGVYRKAHLFWSEKKFFAPGNTPFRVYDIGKARIGMMICFDWLFPEAARTLALKGADIICHPSNLVLPYCPEAMITRCLENRVFAITANRTGAEERVKGKRLEFIGTSEIVSPGGVILARASSDRAEVMTAVLDISAARRKKINPLNDIFKDRRRDLFKV